jgi:hypothetical protein
MRRLRVLGLGLVLTVACGCASERAGRSVAETEPAGASAASVAAYFSPPRPFPGLTWTRSGRPVRDRLATGIDLPADARDTGYRNGGLQVWLSPPRPDTAYLRAGDDVEGWPRADRVLACA